MRKADPFNLLRLLYASGPLSRTDLAKKSGTAASYVTAVISRTQASGIVSETGALPSTRGRRRVLLSINPDLAQLLGVDIGRWHVRIAVADFAAGVREYVCIKSEAALGREHVLQLVQNALERILPKYPQIAGVGISHSGVINQREGKVLFWPQFTGWEDTPLKEIFEQKYGLPTFVQDEVRAMASMEHRFGQGKDLRNFVFLYVGMGIGSAIYVNGRLYSGSDGLAGEMGHTTVENDGPLCSCGNRGCLELYASAAALITRVRSELGHRVSSTLNGDRNLDSLSIEEIAAAAEANDRLAARVLSEGGGYLGTALAGVVNLLNPERIILAGKVPRSQEGIYFTSLLYNLRDRAYPQATRNLQVVVSQLGEDAAALGAAVIAGEHVLKTRCREMEQSNPGGLGKDPKPVLQQDTFV